MIDTWPSAITAILGPITPFLLVGMRAFGLAWTAPALGSVGIGWRIRLGLVAMIAIAVTPAAISGTSYSTVELARLAPIELAVGAMLGLSASLVLAGARQAGEMVGVQAGLSPASLLDPDAGDELNPIGHLYGLVALGVFLSLDGPVGLVKSLVESYRAIPPGGWALSAETVDTSFARVGWALGLALRAAAPAAVAMILAGIVLGMLGRAAPSLSLFSYSLPIRVVVGLLLVLIGIGAVAGAFAAAWSEVGIRIL